MWCHCFFLSGNTFEAQSEDIGFESGCQRRLFRTPSWKNVGLTGSASLWHLWHGRWPHRSIEAKTHGIQRLAIFRCLNQACFLVIKSLTQDQPQLQEAGGVTRRNTPRRVAYAGCACPEKAVLPGKGFDHRRRVEQKRPESELGSIASRRWMSQRILFDWTILNLVKPCTGIGKKLLYTPVWGGMDIHLQAIFGLIRVGHGLIAIHSIHIPICYCHAWRLHSQSSRLIQYIYIYMFTHTHIYIYIYIHTYNVCVYLLSCNFVCSHPNLLNFLTLQHHTASNPHVKIRLLSFMLRSQC